MGGAVQGAATAEEAAAGAEAPGGGGGANERPWLILKKRKLMVGTGNRGFASDGRSREMNSGPMKFLQVRRLRIFAPC